MRTPLAPNEFLGAILGWFDPLVQPVRGQRAVTGQHSGGITRLSSRQPVRASSYVSVVLRRCTLGHPERGGWWRAVQLQMEESG